MWYILRNLVIKNVGNKNFAFRQTKRYAGHSKWFNIKHIKTQKDSERATLFAKLARQMRIAITEAGSCKPSDNAKLAQIIEVAKKKSMPLATINMVLEKAAKSPTTTEISTVDIKGPGGCIMIIEIMTDNVKGLKATLNNIFKKNKVTVVNQSSRHVFDYKGFIISEINGNLDKATEDAIAVGAEDVEEIDFDGEKCFQFTCEGMAVAKVVNQLNSRNYKIISSEDRYIPNIYASLTDADIDRAKHLYEKLEAIEEVVRVHDNIA